MSEPPDKRSLPLAPEALPAPTIMSRTLAAAHGAPYVQLAAFAIDVDRVYALGAGGDALPFGWEVFLVESYLQTHLPAGDEATLAMLEDACLAVLAQPPDEQGFGSQLAFAVYDAVRRGLYPKTLERAFAQWRGASRQLARALDALFEAGPSARAAAARHCLQAPLEPGLSPPTRQALRAMCDAAG